jgi:hypothetical protein
MGDEFEEIVAQERDQVKPIFSAVSPIGIRRRK